MANVFGILTAIVLALAGFVAYKNKAAYETEISNTDQEKTTLDASQRRLKIAQDNFVATHEKRVSVDAEVVAQTAKEAAQLKTNDGLTQQIAAKTAQTEPNKAKLDAIREKTAKIGDIKDLATKMRTLKSELEEVTQSLTTAEAKLANLTSQNNQAESQANSSKTNFEKYTTGQSLSSLNTRIRAIYPTWGFVTLACGNNGGVVAHSTLNVMRDGAIIAKLLVNTVETSSASASIIPDSIAQNVTLMVGDRVVPSYQALATTKHAAPGKAAATPVAPATPAAAPATPEPAAAPATPEPAATPATPEPAAAPATPEPAAGSN